MVKDGKLSKTAHKCLPSSFFARETITVAPELLGKYLLRRFEPGIELAFPLIEVEAYTQEDAACHAYKGVTSRCRVMFEKPGLAYVYFIYGMYHCLNVVTEPKGRGCAILIRGLGAPLSFSRESEDFKDKFLRDNHKLAGPGRLCRALNIDLTYNGISLTSSESPLQLIDLPEQEPLEPPLIRRTKRIGITKDADRLWRFLVG
ncbi:MAG: DNA-3-methyladenine glycosylase [Candidatus Obscuribacterales bacterium]|nr:DNA-3-methyladenine glycosylase [Candidatus Obscuribacterales bacterium]